VKQIVQECEAIVWFVSVLLMQFSHKLLQTTFCCLALFFINIVRYCVEYLYSQVTVGLKLYLAV
jgi:hypothetical protein